MSASSLWTRRPRPSAQSRGPPPGVPSLPPSRLPQAPPLAGLPAFEVLPRALLLLPLADLMSLRLALLGLALLLDAPALLRLLRAVSGLPAVQVLPGAFLLL